MAGGLRRGRGLAATAGPTVVAVRPAVSEAVWAPPSGRCWTSSWSEPTAKATGQSLPFDWD